MPKGQANKRYTPEFKKHVVETMREEGLSYRETERSFELPKMRAAAWERIYLEEESEGFAVERRGRSSKGRPRKLPEAVEEDLPAEVQRPFQSRMALPAQAIPKNASKEGNLPEYESKRQLSEQCSDRELPRTTQK